MGLKALNNLTKSTAMSLLVELVAFDGQKAYAKYYNFVVEDQVMTSF